MLELGIGSRNQLIKAPAMGRLAVERMMNCANMAERKDGDLTQVLSELLFCVLDFLF